MLIVVWYILTAYKYHAIFHTFVFDSKKPKKLSYFKKIIKKFHKKSNRCLCCYYETIGIRSINNKYSGMFRKYCIQKSWIRYKTVNQMDNFFSDNKNSLKRIYCFEIFLVHVFYFRLYLSMSYSTSYSSCHRAHFTHSQPTQKNHKKL